MAQDESAAEPASSALVAEPPQKAAGISQVTHINSYAPSDRKLPGWAPPSSVSDSPVQLLTKLGDGVQEHKDSAGFVRNPKLVKEDVKKQKERLEAHRDSLDDAGRLVNAEELKAEANAQFGKERWRVALVGYLAGLWFLRRGEPPCPLLVSTGFATGTTASAEFKRAFAEVAANVSAAAYGDGEREGALRTSLHLNMAQAALKCEAWPLARAASECVLSAEPAHSKALFRLAKAHEGEGDLSRAVSIVTSLIKQDAQNRDARRLLEALRKQQADMKGAFKNIFAEPASEQ